jgi:hypothetical protein
MDAAASTLGSTLAAGSGIMDAADAMGTYSRRATDAVGTSSRMVRSGMICILSNYRLRIKILGKFM